MALSGSSSLSFSDAGPFDGYLIDPLSFGTDKGRDKATHSLAEWAIREYLIEQKRWDSVAERHLEEARKVEAIRWNPPPPKGALHGKIFAVCRAAPKERKWIKKEIDRCGGSYQEELDNTCSHLLVWQQAKVRTHA